MPWFKRHEGTLVEGESPMRLTMPYLMPGRNEAIVFTEHVVDVSPLLAYLERKNAGQPERRVSFFHAAACAIIRAIGARPKMNRFVVGRRIYQRKWIDVSFALKKRLDDDGAMGVVKVRFEPDDTIETVARRMDEAVNRNRGKRRSSSESEMHLFVKLPRSVRRLALWVLRALDYFNLLPAAMIDADELYASIFLGNLGSVGLEAPFHHLYEWGTCPFFGTIGLVRKAPWVDEKGQLCVRDVCSFKFSYDERIADGYYGARSLDLFKSYLADPESMERPPAALGPGQEPQRREPSLPLAL